MPDKRIFVGSSSAAKTQAKQLIRGLARPGIEFLPWWDAFTAGRTLLHELDQIRTSVDAALILFTPDILATLRDKTVAMPNQNVLFEFGYFYGCLGCNKVAIVKYSDFYLPSDLGGYIHIYGSGWFKANHGTPASQQTKNEFERWVSKL